MTDEFVRKCRPPYSGRVIDGPFEGEWIESETPHFVGHFHQPISALYTGLPAGFEIDRALYRWLSSYRAWVWLQPTGKSRPVESDASLRTRLAAHPDVARDPIAANAVAIAIGVELDKLAYLHGVKRYLPPGTPRPDICVGGTHTGRLADALAFRGDQFGGFKS